MLPLLTRRSLLAGAAASVAAPSLALAQKSDDVDIVVIGAGVAGIAAARSILAAKRRVVVLEAADRVGGRCITDTRLFGVPLDRGAHWLYARDSNPLTKFGGPAKLDVYPAPPGQRIRIGQRYARESELEDFLSVLVRARRAIAEAARGKTDISCAQALPKDLGEWRDTIEFVLGPVACSKDLSEVSAADFSRMGSRDSAAFCRQGLGTLVARLADELPVRLSTPVTRIETWRRGRVTVETPRGNIVARGAIVTVSTNVLAAGKINFDPNLPRRQADAIDNLRLGSYDRIALEMTGSPFGPQGDDLIYQKTDGVRTARMLANASGTQICMIDVGGKFGRELAAQGERAMADFAVEWLTGLYGADIRQSVKRAYATQWNKAPFVLGAFSAASPGGQSARTALMEPVRGRVWFAGEALHETLWGTVGGAWESGERAAEAAMRQLGFIASPREPVAERPVRRRSRPRRRAPQAQPGFWPFRTY
ncbi:MAG: NAD(P)/FAD-dependent oxidoreductase [Xanthobacteraceae bacterium]